MKKNDIKGKLAKFNTVKENKKVENIDELGVELYIKPFKAVERMRLLDKLRQFFKIEGEKEIPDNVNEGNFKYMIFCLFESLVDIDGEKIFDNYDETMETCSNFPDGMITKIYDQIVDYNNLNKTEDEDPGKKQQSN